MMANPNQRNDKECCVRGLLMVFLLMCLSFLLNDQILNSIMDSIIKPLSNPPTVV